MNAPLPAVTRRPTYSEMVDEGQREIDALRERIERLEAQLTTSRAEAELFRAQLLLEGVQPYYTGPMD